MTIYEEIKQELETHLSSRERRFRAKAMRELVLRKMGLENQMFFPMNKLDEYGTAFESYMRICRQVQIENEDLRGSDWEDKTALEQKKQIELGYEPNYHKLSRLAV